MPLEPGRSLVFVAALVGDGNDNDQIISYITGGGAGAPTNPRPRPVTPTAGPLPRDHQVLEVAAGARLHVRAQAHLTSLERLLEDFEMGRSALAVDDLQP